MKRPTPNTIARGTADVGSSGTRGMPGATVISLAGRQRKRGVNDEAAPSAAGMPRAAITQPPTPVAASEVNAPLPASAPQPPRPGGGRRS